MPGPEYDAILASLQEIVRQAYALGRSDALKHVVDVMKADESSWKQPLALTGPGTTAEETAVTDASAEAAAAEAADTRPWWFRKADTAAVH
jgi:hypothetical protein